MSGVRTSTTCVCSWKNWRDLSRERDACEKPKTQQRFLPVRAWKCQSGPNSLSPISARRSLDLEVGEWLHGWQCHTLFATSVHLPPLSTRASQRGPCASRHVSCTCQETVFSAEEFRTLPAFPLGRLANAAPAAVYMARICREPDARVKENHLFRDLPTACHSGRGVARGRRQEQAIQATHLPRMGIEKANFLVLAETKDLAEFCRAGSNKLTVHCFVVERQCQISGPFGARSGT